MTPPNDAVALAGAFRSAILEPGLPTPAGVTAWGGGRADKRFAVYRNNVTVSLVNALADIFPAVSRIVGAALFADIARAYLRAHPPAVPMLAEYGRDFPGFLAACPPVAHLAYLPDVARLERLWLDAFHAADRAPLHPQALGAVAAEDLANIRFQPHPATSLLASGFAVITIFTENRFSETVGAIDTRQPEFALVTRPQLEVKVTGVTAGEHGFLRALASGLTLGDAAAEAIAVDPAFDIGGAIGRMISAGAFSSTALPAT